MGIRDMHDKAKRAKGTWGQRHAVWVEYKNAGEEIRKQLPFPTVLGHTYNPSDRGSNAGGDHICLEVPIVVGRICRNPGDALCKTRDKFWGLELKHGYHVSCLKCLEIAERIVEQRRNHAAETGPSN